MEMEVVLGSGEEVKPKDCSTENESAKELDSGEKTLENDVVGQENGVRVSENGEKKSDVDDGQENGVRVSENGEEKCDDGGEETKEHVVETEKLNESGVIEDCVMNGVSSLLKLKQDVSDKEKDEIDEDEEEDGEDDDEEEEEEEEHGYYVGDFVWGKIKNHPWWPGQIYEPSEASDLALKIKQKGKLLVAYFGDGTFAWCGASQLKPFAESFKDCSKMSNSRSFVGAVEEAVEEMGRHIERVLICDCAEGKHKFDNPVANNAGIKEGVLVRDVRREMISSLLIGKHGEILRDVKCFAETGSFSSLLELEILKRKVSAFYRSKRGYGLTEYHEPQSVPGLEDKNNDDDDDDDVDENVDDGIEWRAKRSSIEAAFNHGESSVQRSLEKCSGFPDHRLLHRRKEKSIADILENESAAKVRFETEPVDGDEKSDVKSARKKTKRRGEVNGELENAATTTPRRRRKTEVSTVEDAGRKQVGESSKSKTVSSKRKKGHVDNDDDEGGDRKETGKNKVSDLEIDIDSTPLASLRKKVRVDGSNVEKSTENGETTTQTSKRERKKSKYLSPEFLSDFSSKGRKKSKIESESSKVSSLSQVVEQMTEASDSLVALEEDKLDKPGEPSLDNGSGREELSEELSNAVDFLRLGATPEEMGDLIRVAALGTQYPKDSSSRDMVREFMTIYRSFTYHEGANHKFLGTYDSSDKVKEELTETSKSKTKGTEIKDKKRKGKQQVEETEEIGKEENETDKKKKERKRKKAESKKLAGDGEETQKELSESTKKERKRKKKKLADGEEDTGKEPSESTKKERKRKKRESKVDKEEETQKESSESTKKERKRKKPKHDEEETRNESVEPEKKKKKKKREGKSKEKETEKEFSGAELFATFGPGSSLPKKEDLIEIYEKFGALDKERTDMISSNFCARVAFLDVADGEKAFEFSQEKSPFTSASTVKFRLKYPNEKTEEKKTEAEVAELTMVKKKHLKKKLKRIVTLLDECEGEMTEEVYVKFEGKLVNLLEKVRERS